MPSHVQQFDITFWLSAMLVLVVIPLQAQTRYLHSWRCCLEILPAWPGGQGKTCCPSIRNIMCSDLKHSNGIHCHRTHQCPINTMWCHIHLKNIYILIFAFIVARYWILWDLKSLENNVRKELQIFKDLRNNIYENRERKKGKPRTP